METVAEPVELQDVVVEAPDAPDAPEPAPVIDAKRTRAPRVKEPRAKAEPKARARKPAPEPVAEPVAPEPVPVPEPAPAPKARARKPAPAPAAAPTPAPASIEDVMGMLAAALADQRQTRTAQRREMYRGFLE